MRILHAPVNFSDQAGYVVRALRRAGHEAELWQYGPSKWGFAADRTIDVTSESPHVLWETFEEAARSFDVFHFHFGRSLFPFAWSGLPPYWDLPVLKALGKKVFFSFLGSDCRLRRVHREHNPWSDRFFADFEPDDDRIAKSINVIRTYADRMFVLSRELSLYVPEAELMPRSFDLSEWPELPPADREVPVVIHAPSRRAFKGTDLVVNAMSSLSADGIPFEFRLIEGVPHDDIKKMIADADVVVDNVTMGDHAITSVEAMACNRVAVAYLMEPVKAGGDLPPVFEATPDDLVERMRVLLTDRSLRRSHAEKGRAYVAAHFGADTVARRHLERYEAEPRPVPARAFPDWMGYGDARKIERVEARLAEIEQDRAAAKTLERQARERAAALSKELISIRQQLEARGVRRLFIPAARRVARRLRKI